MEIVLKSNRFRREREADWRRLENLLDRFERGSAAALTDDEILALPLLYRAALSSLSVARAISLDRSLLEYLEGLSARAYFCVYGARATLPERLAQFFLSDWPRAVRALWRETLIAGALTLVGAAAAFLLTRQSPDWFGTFVPATLALGRDPEASARFLRGTLLNKHGADGLTVFSAFLFTHNAQIALGAFALGFACCLPTALLMLYNGMMLGAFFAVFQSRGLGIDFGGWALIHGVTELFAVTLAGAAGFHVGWAIAFPGRRRRLDALAGAGRLAAIVMAGVIVMLAVAGLLEGFGRQLIAPTPFRYAVAAISAVIWCLYFYGRRDRI
ncbi:MAG TPA: stage II sporulation protein M [Rhizomicrobium sp.]